jgi:hypothetical protein
MKSMRWFEILRWSALLGAMAWTVSSAAQDAARRADTPAAGQSIGSTTDSIRELRDEIRELQAIMAEMRSDWQRARAETAELRRELDEIRGGAGPRDAVLRAAVVNSETGAPQENQGQEAEPKPEQKKSEHGASLEEEYQLLSGKVDDQYQTKVESASKYRLRLSGIVLMNMVSNQGVVDSVDLPMLAYARPAGVPDGSFGATLRQSEIGLEAFGPAVAGAKTRADLQLDLAGGFPQVANGINSGLVRLRMGTMRMDWTNTSIVAGQDAIFFSPDSPTSFASLAIPSLSAAGNLWSWVPQVRVEHRVTLGEESSLLLQAGILDPVTGEAPISAPGYYRVTGPGESSRQPAYGTRIAWTRNVFGQPLRVGAGGYYGRQNYGFSRTVDGWAGMTDIELPLNRQLSLSGKLYRGKALGGFYGGIGRSVLFSNDPSLPGTEVRGLNTVGGWAQLKCRPANKWELNAAFGMDNPYASDLKYFPYAQAYGDATLARNRGSFGNVIYRPRSDLLFSAEYRYLTTYTLTNGGNSAGQLNLMMGVLF